jgi:hypothetical protein
MGTRGLTIVKSEGKIKVAQYGQWDHYPTGQGKTVARFIQNELDFKKFKKKVDALQEASEELVMHTWVDCGANPDSDTVSFDVSDYHAVIYPEFSRDTGAEILGLIQDAHVTHVFNEYEFLKDTVFCEYAYLIDLDKKTVSVYAGSTRPIKKYAFKDFTEQAMDELENFLNK